MKQSETKLNDVRFDDLDWPKKLEQRRFLLILLNIAVFVSAIVLVRLAGVYIANVANDKFHIFSDSMTMVVVFITVYCLWDLIFYYYDPEGKSSEKTINKRKLTLIFSISILLVHISIYYREDLALMKTGIIVFLMLIYLCLHFFEDKLYFKHLIRFYREIEAKHSSTKP